MPTYRDFRRGWYAMGPSESSPPGTLRRAIGIAPPSDRASIRSRRGSDILATPVYDIHSLYRFADIRFVGRSTALNRVDASLTLVKSGLDGTRLTFVRMPPSLSAVDYLFVAGGGTLFKVDASGTATNWGITPPPNGFTQADNGAGNLSGVYQYLVTFRNSTSGSRSNANPTPVTTASLTTRQIRLSSLPTSTDTQVNRREIWRTLSGGAVYFLAGTVNDNTTTTFDDNVADASLGTEELPTDNIVPYADLDDAVGPHYGRMWWTRRATAGDRGRVFYSPIGRPEGMVGFLDVSSDDDPVQKIVTQAGRMFAFSESYIFEILGTDEPFLSRKVAGSVGTTAPFTVRETPIGIAYEASDGVRLFNGVTSTLLSMPALTDLFRGVQLGNVEAFTGVFAEYANREYFISDEAWTLAVDLDSGAWRNIGLPARALYFEPDTHDLLIGTWGAVRRLEVEGLETDATGAGITGIYFEIEIPAWSSGETSKAIMTRVYIDANTNGQGLTPTLLLDDTEIPLPMFSTAARATVEYGIGRAGYRIALRLAGTLPTAAVEIFAITCDVYMPALAGATP